MWQGSINLLYVYVRPRDEAMLSDDEVMQCVHGNSGANVKGKIVKRPTENSTIDLDKNVYGTWVSVFGAEFDGDGVLDFHAKAKDVFVGECRVQFSISYFDIAKEYRSACITLKNISQFDIPEYTLGYKVGDALFRIPCKLRKGICVELPWFEVPSEARVEMHSIDELLPVKYLPMVQNVD
jgi:hypothetical protein